MRPASTLLFLLPSVLASCSSFGEDAPAADAGAGVLDSGVDGQVDAGVEAGPGPIPTCPPKAFCDTFERDDVMGPWSSSPAPQGNNAIRIDSSTRVSGTRSLLVTTSGATGNAYVLRGLPAAKAFDVDFSLRVDLLPGSGILVGQVSFENATVITVAVNDRGIKISEQNTAADAGTAYGESESVALATDTWVRLSFHVESGTARLTAPDAVPPVRISYPLKNPTTSTKSFRLGIVFTPVQTIKPRLWFDDVVIR